MASTDWATLSKFASLRAEYQHDKSLPKLDKRSDEYKTPKSRNPVEFSDRITFEAIEASE